MVLRNFHDTDNAVEVMERFDNCDLNPSSPNFVARKIGDKYWSWDTNEVRLKQYGEYDSKSNFVYVEMNSDVEAGASDPLLLPFGYFGPPTFTQVLSGSGAGENLASSCEGKFVTYTGSIAKAPPVRGVGAVYKAGTGHFISGGHGSKLTASLYWPVDRLRISASDGGLTDPTRAYF